MASLRYTLLWVIVGEITSLSWWPLPTICRARSTFRGPICHKRSKMQSISVKSLTLSIFGLTVFAFPKTSGQIGTEKLHRCEIRTRMHMSHSPPPHPRMDKAAAIGYNSTAARRLPMSKLMVLSLKYTPGEHGVISVKRCLGSSGRIYQHLYCNVPGPFKKDCFLHGSYISLRTRSCGSVVQSKCASVYMVLRCTKSTTSKVWPRSRITSVTNLSSRHSAPARHLQILELLFAFGDSSWKNIRAYLLLIRQISYLRFPASPDRWTMLLLASTMLAYSTPGWKDSSILSLLVCATALRSSLEQL